MPLSDQEIDAKLRNMSGWQRTSIKSQSAIEKTFKTGDFLSGLAFLTRVAVLAEGMNHHPDVVFTYPRVTLQLTTHDAGGLSDKDFELARRIDALPL
jgi:4a-hydroxytetrahydrobiopterin dehydratase